MDLASILAQKPPWLARLPREDEDRVAGAGMLVDNRHVLTSAHVVAQQVGQPAVTAGKGPAPRSEVLVEFPFAEPVVRRSAHVVQWWPIAHDLSGDAAMLRLTEPVGLTPVPLVCPPSLQGHRFSVHGFPRGDYAARQARGRLGGASGPAGEWIQMESDSPSGWPVEHGFSGAPVFDHDEGGVVGMVALRDEHRSAHLLPISYLRTSWPSLSDLVRWRLDLDPSLTTHWLPHARGSEVESDSGRWHFTGRDAARQAVCDWLPLADQEQPLLVVTGGPGTGKSALLAHLLVASDPILGDDVPRTGPRPPRGSFDGALHVKGNTRDGVVALLARMAAVIARSPGELLVALRERRSATGRPFVLLADAIDEAAGVLEAQWVARLLWELASARTLRVVVGVRTAPAGSEQARILEAFGRSTPRIHLESPQYHCDADVEEYVERRLVEEELEGGRYRSRPDTEVRAIAQAVAAKAGHNFLIAQVTSRWLLLSDTPTLDPALPAWDRELPETIADAMERYLDAFGPDKALVERLLTALAFSLGEGLPRGPTWLAIADALHPDHSHSRSQLAKVFDSAASYLVERSDTPDGHPAYRLYHEALDEHLHARCARRVPQRAIVDALVGMVPVGDGRRVWGEADHYIRAHLARHAAQSGQLDALLGHAGFLTHAEPSRLLGVLPQTATDQGRLAAAVYRASSHSHRGANPEVRCRLLAVDAARFGAHDLQRELNATLDGLKAPASSFGWRVHFATGSKIHPANIATLSDHNGMLTAVAAGTSDGRSIGVSGSYGGTMRIWDLAEQRPIGDTIVAMPSAHVRQGITALAVTELDGRPVAISGGDDGKAQVWDLLELRQIGQTLAGHTRELRGLASGEVDGRPIAVTVSADETVRIWDLLEQRQLGGPLTGHTSAVTSVAITELDGRAIAVTASILDRTIRVWDLHERRQVGEALRSPDSIGSLAVTQLDGSPIAVTGSGGNEGTLRMWDLKSGCQIGVPLTGHGSWVTGIATTVLDGRPIAVSASGGGKCGDGPDKSVRVWDLAKGRQIGDAFTGHTSGPHAVATTLMDGRPIAMTAGGWDGTVRLWDLAEAEGQQIGDPLVGHGDQVTALALTECAGQRFAVSGGLDKSLRAWDVFKRSPTHSPLPVAFPTALAFARVRGRPVALACGIGITMMAWDMLHGRSIAVPLRFPEAYAHGEALDVAYVGERPVVAVAASNRSLYLWDLLSQRLRAQPVTTSLHVHAIALTMLHGHLIAATAGRELGGRYGDCQIQLWDLTVGRAVGDLERAASEALAVADMDGRQAVITAGDHGVVRVRDLVRQRTVTELTGHTGVVRSVVAGSLGGRPIAITAGSDQMLKVWDLRTTKLIDELRIPDTCRGLALGEQGTLAVAVEDDLIFFQTHALAEPLKV